MIKSIFKFFFLYTSPFLFLCFSCIFYVGLLTYFSDKELWNHWVFETKQYLAQEKISKFLFQEQQVQSQQIQSQEAQEYQYQKIYKAKANVLNIRELPSVDSKIIGKIYKNQEVIIYDIENSWGKMQKGYVFLDPKNIQKIDLQNEDDLNKVFKFYKVKASAANIRKEPLSDSPIIAKAYQGEMIEIQEWDTIWGKSKKGFIALRLLEKVDE